MPEEGQGPGSKSLGSLKLIALSVAGMLLAGGLCGVAKTGSGISLLFSTLGSIVYLFSLPAFVIGIVWAVIDLIAALFASMRSQ